MKASDLFIKALENEGVEYIFGVPGEENLDLVESIRNSNIKLIITRHEQGAGFMAATCGRLSGKTGVCLSTLGPGATNLVTAAAHAQLAAIPLLMITGQKPIKQSKQGKFQIIDTVEMMRPITKFTKQIVNSHMIPALIREGFRVAEEERPGAVHLELPEDIAREDCDASIFAIHKTYRPSAGDPVVEKAAELIQAAQMPLLLMGAGANRKRTTQALRKLIDKTGLYFFNTQMGKGAVDERHPSYIGTAALSDFDYLHCAINRADLIINVGHDIVEKPPFFMKKGGAKVVHINFFSAHIDEVYFPDHEVIGDIATSVEKLAHYLTPQSRWDFAYYAKIKQEVEKQISSGADDDRFPLLPQRIVRDVREALKSDAILTLDNGMYKIWFARNYKAHKSNTILLDNALATMGAGLPAAMGARLEYPDRQVVAVCGDGGFMMNSQELETAVRLKLDLVVIILVDKGYGMIKWKQESMGFEDFGLDFTNPDFVKYAESYGARGHRVNATDEFSTLLNDCLAHPGVDVIEVPIDYSENANELGEKLLQKTCVL